MWSAPSADAAATSGRAVCQRARPVMAGGILLVQPPVVDAVREADRAGRVAKDRSASVVGRPYDEITVLRAAESLPREAAGIPLEPLETRGRWAVRHELHVRACEGWIDYAALHGRDQSVQKLRRG